MTIKLYDLVGRDEARPFSPHCWKIAMALAHKGLAFERVPTPFVAVKGVEHGFHGLVPVIRDGDRLVGDSFAIALDLERRHADRPTLFGGAGGEAAARFVERWTQTVLHPYLGASVAMDIHAILDDENRAFFRDSRERRFGKALEDVPAGRDRGLAGFRTSLEPLRSMLSVQPFIGGAGPLFADYIVFGSLQWVRVASPYRFLEDDDPVAAWFGRCLDLHGGLGRGVPAAA